VFIVNSVKIKLNGLGTAKIMDRGWSGSNAGYMSAIFTFLGEDNSGELPTFEPENPSA